MIRKIVDLITKETNNENESKDLVVVLRISSLIILAYFLIIIAVAVAYKLFFTALTATLFFALYFCFLASTYRLRMLFVYYGFSAATVLWILFSIAAMGWEIETYLLMLPLVVIRFFEAHSQLRSKVIFSLCLFAFTVLLYVFSLNITPTINISDIDVFFQILNMTVVFSGIIMVCWFFSSEALRDESKLVSYNKRLQHDAFTDALTGLANRRSMIQELSETIRRVKNNQAGAFSIAIGDIDFFKKVNDTLGHDCGDVVLQELSKMFAEFIEGKGNVARWGGEEFLFIFDNMNGDEALIELHNLMRVIRNSQIICKKEKVQVTMTFGLEEFDINNDLDENLKNADNKLYLGKNSGRNKIVY